MKKFICFLAATLLTLGSLAYAQQNQQEKRAMIRHNIIKALLEEKFRIWIQDPMVVEAIKQQNGKHASLAQVEVERLDKQWRAERKTAEKPLIDSILVNPLSQFLKTIKAQNPNLYNEIFVMDNRGLNVGQSDVTSDYWQGDEDKWKETYPKGPDVIHIGKYEYDESVGKYQAQLSVSIADPDTGAAIGTVTIGLGAWEMLRERAKIRRKAS